MSAFNDYVGRIVDLSLFAGWTAGTTLANLQMTLSNGDAGVVTGIAKLVQRFLLTWLTDQGSMPYLPNAGTDFMLQLQSGSIRTDNDAIAFFGFAMQSVSSQMQAEELATDPNDERFASAVLLGTSIVGDTLTYSVQVNSLAGSSRQVILPIPLSPLGI